MREGNNQGQNRGSGARGEHGRDEGRMGAARAHGFSFVAWGTSVNLKVWTSQCLSFVFACLMDEIPRGLCVFSGCECAALWCECRVLVASVYSRVCEVVPCYVCVVVVRGNEMDEPPLPRLGSVLQVACV